MTGRQALAAGLGLALSLGLAPGRTAAVDRLERFRGLATAWLGPAQLASADGGEARAAELYALVDDEIVENLESGEPFASLPFIQERLDAFGNAWGGAAFRVTRVRGAPGRLPLTLGVFTLAGVTGSGSVRLYGQTGSGVGLLRTMTHDGVPEIHEWPAARDGAAQFVAAWAGVPSGRGTRPLHLELWRQRGDADAVRVWSSADLFADGLWVSDVAVGRGEILLRYAPRYPGWKPGCDGQTEHEDVYRWIPASETLALARRRVFNSWHRELQTAVARFFAALARGDRGGLRELVPDSSLRSQLPASLRPEPACEAQSPDTPGTVVVAATEERAPRGAKPGGAGLAPQGEPWSLWWSLRPGGWRLAGAARVLQ